MEDILRYVPERWMLIGQREKLGLSQEEVAAKAGIRLDQYRKYESHEGHFSNSSMRIVNAVLTVLELDPTALAKGEYAFERLPDDHPLSRLSAEIG